MYPSASHFFVNFQNAPATVCVVVPAEHKLITITFSLLLNIGVLLEYYLKHCFLFITSSFILILCIKYVSLYRKHGKIYFSIHTKNIIVTTPMNLGVMLNRKLRCIRMLHSQMLEHICATPVNSGRYYFVLLLLGRSLMVTKRT